MNNTPRQILNQIVTEYSPSLYEDPQRVEAILRDLCGEYKSELHALLDALKDGVVKDLMTSSETVPLQILLARLAQRLQEEAALEEKAARWAVESWAIALGRELPTKEEEEPLVNIHNAAYFLLSNSDGSSQKFPLPTKIITIGRTPNNYISLSNDPKISRQHAQLSPRRHNEYVISDLGSGLGTFVNGIQLNPGELKPLEDKDQIRVGDTLLYFFAGSPISPTGISPSHPFMPVWVIGTIITVSVISILFLLVLLLWFLSPWPITLLTAATPSPTINAQLTPALTTSPSTPVIIATPSPENHGGEETGTPISSTSTPTLTPTQQKILGVVTTERLNVRSGPSQNYEPPIDLLLEREKVTILRRTPAGDWLEIITPKQQKGWVSGKYIEVLDSIEGVEVASNLEPTPTPRSNQPVIFDLAGGSIVGKLNPFEERWYSFYEEDNETSISLIFKPKYQVEFFIHDERQIPNWPPGDLDTLQKEPIGAGSYPSGDRDGDLNTGELIYKGGGLQRDIRYYIRLVNRSDKAINYCLTPREVFTWSCQ